MADRVINYYEVLGVPRSASQTEIRNAYRNLAKERHPDHPSGSEAQFTLLQEANATLSDPNRRRQYDEQLDLQHAADQLASLDLDFGGLEDELASRRRQREQGPGLGERLRGRFRRKESLDDPGDEGRGRRRGRDEGRGGGRNRGRYTAQQEARWYEVQDFDPEPVTWRTGAFSFFGAFLGFLLVGQIGLWATGAADPGILTGLTVLSPFMFLLYTLAGLLASYFAYRAAGYAGVALVFVAALVVAGSGGPENMLQLTTLGVAIPLILILLGRRRDAARRR
jgi:molecular chaperone DnaJ